MLSEGSNQPRLKLTHYLNLSVRFVDETMATIGEGRPDRPVAFESLWTRRRRRRSLLRDPGSAGHQEAG